jgi:hypothetical protein
MSYVQTCHLLDLQPSNGDPIAAIAMLGDDPVYLSPTGHFLATEKLRDDLIYIVQTKTGEQLTLSPDEFEKKYG